MSATAPDDGRRYPQRPVVGVAAVLLRGGSVLLAKRGKPPMMGWWTLPGGAVETGETLEAAVRRETLEETGLAVRPAGVLEIVERIMRDAAGAAEYHYVLMDYFCHVESGSLRAGDDVAAVEWVKRADLGRYPLTEGAAEVIEKAFRTRRRFQTARAGQGKFA